MKIGVLTYHRAENYGAVLQAYALRTYLSSLGNDVSFVDYWPNYHRDYFKLFSWNQLVKSGLKTKIIMLNNLFFYRIRKKRKQNFQKFMYDKMGLPKSPKYTSCNDVCKEFDVVFYGSDQIWRKQGMVSHPGFDNWYFGSDNIVTSRKIAYAASMGMVDLADNEKDVLKKSLSAFNSLSVRESSLYELLVSIGLQCQLVCDPVFLVNPEQWRILTQNVKKPQGKYILMYNLLSSEETVRFAEALSNKYHLPIIEISKQYQINKMGKRYNHTATIEEFIALVDNAEYVVSNSFHGVAFSIILEKQFFAVGMGCKAGRVQSLLSLLNISDRYVPSAHCELDDIDYSLVSGQLSDMVVKSKQFVTDSLV